MKYYDDLLVQQIGQDVFVMKADGDLFLLDNITGSIAQLSKELDYDNESQMQKLYSLLDPDRPLKRIITTQSIREGKQFGRLMIYLTDACNMRCVYCHCESGIGGNMSDETIEKTLEKYCSHIDRKLEKEVAYTGVPQITFMGGGEPFLRIDKIKEIVKKFDNWCGSRNLKPKYVLVTNGTLGTDSDWTWLVKRDFQINLSLDGPSAIQNKYRPLTGGKPSFDLIKKRLLFLGEIGAKVHIRSTILNPEEIKDVCTFFRGFECVESHALEPVSLTGRAKEKAELVTSLRYQDFFREYSKFLFSDPGFYKSSWFKPFNRTSGFCGALFFNSIVLTDGSVCLCSEVDSKKSEEIIKDKFLVSDVYDDTEVDIFESKKAFSFSEEFALNAMPLCSNCVIKYKCGGGCYIKKLRDFPDNEEEFYREFCEPAIKLNLSYLIGSLKKRQND